MKAARRSPARPRSSLLTSGEKLNTRLVRAKQQIAEQRGRGVFIFFGLAPGSPPGPGLAEGERPQKGDVCIYFPSLDASPEEAQQTIADLRAQACQASLDSTPSLNWKRTLTPTDPPQHRREPDPELEALAEERTAADLRPPSADIRPLTEDEMHRAVNMSRPS